MSKKYTEINEDFVHDFIETISQKAEEIKESFGSFSDLESDNPLNFIHRMIFPEMDFRAAHVGGVMPPGVMNPSGFDYVGEDCNKDYLYGFTNSEFIAFLGNLCSTEFIIIITLITILIAESLNTNELSVIALTMEGIGDSLELLAEYRELQESIENEEENCKQQEAMQQDFNYINQQLSLMQARITCLENQLQGKNCSCNGPHMPKSP